MRKIELKPENFVEEPKGERLATPFARLAWQEILRYVPIFDQLVGSRTSRHLA